VADHGSPIVARRRLASELRRLREEAHLTGDQVARRIRWSASKISRYELGRTALKHDEVAKLLDVYKPDRATREELLALADLAASKGWWEDFSDDLPEQLAELIGLEDEAVASLTWQIECVPGLLQTEEYARSANGGFQNIFAMPPAQMERRVRARMLRQQVLTRTSPLQLSVVIDESALLRKVADTTVMRAQLAHLVEMSQLPNVTVQVLRLAREAPLPIISPSFAVLEFDATMPAVAFTENLIGNQHFDAEDVTYRYLEAFQRYAAVAMSRSDSRMLISQISRQVWS
jgi:transcriptional regulator with XRE-family HTH domain